MCLGEGIQTGFLLCCQANRTRHQTTYCDTRIVRWARISGVVVALSALAALVLLVGLRNQADEAGATTRAVGGAFDSAMQCRKDGGPTDADRSSVAPARGLGMITLVSPGKDPTNVDGLPVAGAKLNRGDVPAQGEGGVANVGGGRRCPTMSSRSRAIRQISACMRSGWMAQTSLSRRWVVTTRWRVELCGWWAWQIWDSRRMRARRCSTTTATPRIVHRVTPDGSAASSP